MKTFILFFLIFISTAQATSILCPDVSNLGISCPLGNRFGCGPIGLVVQLSFFISLGLSIYFTLRKKVAPSLVSFLLVIITGLVISSSRQNLGLLPPGPFVCNPKITVDLDLFSDRPVSLFHQGSFHYGLKALALLVLISGLLFLKKKSGKKNPNRKLISVALVSVVLGLYVASEISHVGTGYQTRIKYGGKGNNFHDFGNIDQ